MTWRVLDGLGTGTSPKIRFRSANTLIDYLSNSPDIGKSGKGGGGGGGGGGGSVGSIEPPSNRLS